MLWSAGATMPVPTPGDTNNLSSTTELVWWTFPNLPTRLRRILGWPAIGSRGHFLKRPEVIRAQRIPTPQLLKLLIPVRRRPLEPSLFCPSPALASTCCVAQDSQPYLPETNL